MMQRLVQLYTARNAGPVDGVLDLVQSMGFDGVEGWRASYEAPQTMKEKLTSRGLTMPSGHFAVTALEDEFAEVISAARTLGISLIIAPFLTPEERPNSAGDWIEFGKRLKKLDQKVRAEGFDFAWHNHDFEFRPLADGRYPIDLLLDTAPGMAWQADVSWIIAAGVDPLPLLGRYMDRVNSVHLKDMSVGADWPAIWSAVAAMPRVDSVVAEHDSTDDVTGFLADWSARLARLKHKGATHEQAR